MGSVSLGTLLKAGQRQLPYTEVGGVLTGDTRIFL